MCTRSELTEPGTFTIMPLAIMRAKVLAASTKLVLCAIINRLGTNNDAWPGFGDIAKQTGLGRSTIIRAIKQAEQAEILIITRVTDKSNRYAFHESWKQNLQRAESSVKATLVSERHYLEQPETSVSVTLPTSIKVTPPSVSVTPPSVSVTPLLVSEWNPNQTKKPNQEPNQEPNQLEPTHSEKEKQGELQSILQRVDDERPLPNPVVPSTLKDRLTALISEYRKLLPEARITRDQLSELIPAIQQAEQAVGREIDIPSVINGNKSHTLLAKVRRWAELALQEKDAPKYAITAIWNAYPKKVNQMRAERAIKDALKWIEEEGIAPEGTAAHTYLYNRTKAYASSQEAQREARYIQNPDRWFSEHRFTEEDSAWNPAPRSATGNFVPSESLEDFINQEEEKPKVSIQELIKLRDANEAKYKARLDAAQNRR